MTEFGDDRLDELLNRMNNPARYNPEYSQLKEEPNISPELEFAVSTLVKLRYRDCDDWSVFIEYRFTNDGIWTKTYVDSARRYMRFTLEEAIAIATSLSSKHVNKSDEGES